MWKLAFAGAATVAIVGSSLVYAQERPRFEPGRPSIEDMRLFVDARLAALHAGLGLTADQEKNWAGFDQASHDLAKLRIDRFSQVRDRGPQSRDPADRMHQRAAAMTETGAALQKLADATDPLYKSLTDSQKRRFAILERMLAPRQGGFDFRGRDGFRRDGEGPRPGEFQPRRTDFTPQGGGENL
jgi:zinc resistance-associated protein